MHHLSLEYAREKLMESLDDGARCPCCGKFARRYRRKFNSTMAKSLIWLVATSRNSDGDWVDVPKAAPRAIVRSNQLPTVRWWGMAERPDNEDNPDLKHSGLWRPTEKGIAFVRLEIKVPSTAVTYDGAVEALNGDPINLLDALGEKFSYADIMGQYKED